MLIDHHAYANGSSSGPRPNVVTPTSLTSEHWGVPDNGTSIDAFAAFVSQARVEG